MQYRDNKWGIPIEALAWPLPIVVVIGIITAAVVPKISNQYETRQYKLDSMTWNPAMSTNLDGGIFTEMNTNRTMSQEVFKEFLERAGIEFGRHSTFTIDTNTLILTIRNKRPQLDQIERIMTGLDGDQFIERLGSAP